MKTIEKNKVITVALAGNPNTGKSTIFNALTGGRAHVGNWPGVTVEKKEGSFKYNDQSFSVIDLPGTYSLTGYSIDERIARDFIVRKRPDVIVSVTDSTNLERNLYLLTSLIELGVNLILDLNMIDIFEERKGEIDIKKIEEALGIPVVLTSGLKNTGIEKLKDTIIKTGGKNQGYLKIDYGPDIEKAIENVELQLAGINSPYPKRFLALKILEGDIEIIEEIKRQGFDNAVQAGVYETSKLEKEFGFDLETEIIEKRYGLIQSIVRRSVYKPAYAEEKLSTSDKIDRILTNRWLGIPVFALMMWITFQLTFTLGGLFADYIDAFFGWFSGLSSGWLKEINAPSWISSFISNGIIGGVGSVLIFLPNIMILFLLLSFLEDVGYMARAAFVMDRIMHAIGLPGRSFISIILGFGCNVPAVMSTRTISSEKDRLLTILINPFISCSARLPVYLLFTGILFTKNQGLVVFSLYTLGILVAVLSAKLFKWTIPILKGPVSPLVMELPPYRIPSALGVIIHMWERSSLFLKKAGTIIFAGVIVIWFLASFPLSAEYAGEASLAGQLGKFIAPIFRPAGFPFWQAAVALFFGIIAKEIVVGTFGTLFGGEGKLAAVIPVYFSQLSAYSFMVMSLLYIPCIASIGVIYRETNSWKWTAFSVFYSVLAGYLTAVLIYQIGSFLL